MAGTQGESSGHAQVDEVPAKKKRLSLSFKAFRQLFSRRKRTKSKEEEDGGSGVGIKAKSTNDMLTVNEEDDGSQLSAAKTQLSLSHDSVFNSGAKPGPRGDPLLGSTHSMEAAPAAKHNPFKAELARAVRGRRSGDDQDEADATEVSAEVTDHKADDYSDHSQSMGDSSGEELEEEFFKDKWTRGATSKERHVTSESRGSRDDLDLDMVVSSSSLNTSMLDHKRAVRPKGVRPSSKQKRSSSSSLQAAQQRTTSPKPPAGAVQVLPLLKEETPSADAAQDEDEQEDERMEMSIEEEDEEDEDMEVEVKVEDDSPCPTPEARPATPDSGSLKRHSSSTSSADEKDFRQVVLRKTSQKEVKVVEKEVKVEEKAAAAEVVLRSSPSKQDPSKRSTISSGDSPDVSRFGERKVGKRSSLVEAKNWEDGKPERDSGSEFAAVFSKFQRKSSLKGKNDEEDKPEGNKLILPKKTEAAVKSENRSSTGSVSSVSGSAKKDVSPKVVKGDNGQKAESKKEVVSLAKSKFTPKSESSATKTDSAPKSVIVSKSESSPKVVTISKAETAPKVMAIPKDNVPKAASPKTSSAPPKVATVVKPESTPKVSAAPKTDSTPKVVTVQKPEPKFGAKPDKPTPPKPESKTVTVVVEKPENKAKNSEDKENENYKRSSPVFKNRARSATLPEQPVSIIDKKTEPEPKPIKKATSQEENSSKTTTPSSGNSPQRSSSVLIKPSNKGVEPKRLTIKDSNSKGEPEWFAMARRKTKAFDHDEDKEKKDQENIAKKKDVKPAPETEDAASKRQSRVLDMVKTWQK